MKRFEVVQNISDADKSRIRNLFGASHGNSILRNGIDEDSLPYQILEEEGLLHLFEVKN